MWLEYKVYNTCGAARYRGTSCAVSSGPQSIRNLTERKRACGKERERERML